MSDNELLEVVVDLIKERAKETNKTNLEVLDEIKEHFAIKEVD